MVEPDLAYEERLHELHRENFKTGREQPLLGESFQLRCHSCHYGILNSLSQPLIKHRSPAYRTSTANRAMGLGVLSTLTIRGPWDFETEKNYLARVAARRR